MSAGQASPAPRGPVWFVQAAGKVWGPYPEARFDAFVAEGRVAADTLVGPDPQGPFLAAGRQARLHRLFGDHAVAAAEPLNQAAPAEALAPARPMLVWAALTTLRPELFEAALGAFGPFVRVGPGLWLVRARLGPAALRNGLTRRLDPADRLVVVAAPLDQAAWFNVDGDTDRTLRQLMGSGPVR